MMWGWLVAIGLGLAACGGASDAARPSGPVKKVAWGDASGAEGGEGAEGEATAEQAEPAAEEKPAKPAELKPAPEEEDLAAGGDAIDVDAMPSQVAARAKAAPDPAPVAAAEEEEEEAEEEPAAKAEPEPESPANDPLAAELRKRRAQARARSEASKAKEKAPKKKKKAKPTPDGDVTVSSYKGSDPCRAAKFSVARVREACASGGRPAAKKVMKDAIGKATATGQLLKCSDCHSNQKDYALKDDAVAELKRWLDTSSS